MKPISKRITRGGWGGWKLTFIYECGFQRLCCSSSYFFRREDALAFMVTRDLLYRRQSC